MVQHHITPATAGRQSNANMPELADVRSKLHAMHRDIDTEKALLNSCRTIARNLQESIGKPRGLSKAVNNDLNRHHGFTNQLLNSIKALDTLKKVLTEYGTFSESLYTELRSISSNVVSKEFRQKVKNIQNLVNQAQRDLTGIVEQGKSRRDRVNSMSERLQRAFQ